MGRMVRVDWRSGLEGQECVYGIMPGKKIGRGSISTYRYLMSLI